METRTIRRWDDEEDKILIKIIDKFGDDWRKKINEVVDKYNKKAKEKFGDKFMGRSGSQIRSHLSYLAKKNFDDIGWTVEKDLQLLEAYSKYKDSYSEVAEALGGNISAKDVGKRLKVVKYKALTDPLYKNFRSASSTAQSSRAPSPPSESSIKISKDRRLDDIYNAIENLQTEFETKFKDLKSEIETQTDNIAEIKAMIEQIPAYIKETNEEPKTKKED